MRVLLCQLDGKIPNLALMRIAAHHRALGDDIDLKFGASFRTGLFDVEPDRIYASAIFSKTLPLAQELKRLYPDAMIGGTGYNVAGKVEDVGITTEEVDYSLFPRERRSIGFTQRGCRLRCKFCVVPEKEGAMQEARQSIWKIWRGEPYPRELLLLDNDFFGQPNWRLRIQQIREGKFKVCFSQGINARFLTDEAAEAIASIDYRDNSMSDKCIYTAWDNLKDGARLFDGLRRLVKYGVKPHQITVYMLVGYWPGETMQHNLVRHDALREFGARPYPMPYVRTEELVGFQRWVMGAYDKPSKANPEGIPWEEWKSAHCRPEKLRPFEFPMFPELIEK